MTIRSTNDKRAPMGSAPLRYRPDGAVDWGNMWDSFCALAQEGGPPHRGTMLYAQEDVDTSSPGYHAALREIIRGVFEVSGLAAAEASPGWIAVQCPSAAMAHWLRDAIEQENVRARCDGTSVLVPVGDRYTLTGEIKNVITVVAKTTHYWREHLPPDVRRALWVEIWVARMRAVVRRRPQRPPP